MKDSVIKNQNTIENDEDKELIDISKMMLVLSFDIKKNDDNVENK
jgi:hypothetical protein